MQHPIVEGGKARACGHLDAHAQINVHKWTERERKGWRKDKRRGLVEWFKW
jgi:hypothetical protein